MKILFVHDRFGAFGGAEANILATASELKARGNTVGILHGPRTDKGEAGWTHAFPFRFPMTDVASVAAALGEFEPDIIYVHKLADLEIVADLVDSGVPLVRIDRKSVV